MPSFEITAPDGKKYRVDGPEGATAQQALEQVQKQLVAPASAAPPAPAPAKPFGAQMNDFVADMPRQVGLTARHGLEGVGDTFDAFVGNPLRTLASPILGNRPTARTGQAIADLVNLPTPQTANERIVGDATRMVAGGAGMMGAASKAAPLLTGTAQTVAKSLAANPIKQLASAGAAGTAGGYVRETGGNEGSQLLASLAAGLATPYAMSKGQQVGMSLKQLMNGRAVPTAAQMDAQINAALQPNGVTLEQLAPNVQAGIRQDVAKALTMTDNLSPDALRRLADYRVTGATPTVGKLTRDPAQFTQEENLMRVGANSKDVAAQQLGATKNANNARLIELMNNRGAATSDDALAGAQKIMGELGARNTRAGAIIDKQYAAARDTSGRSAALDPHSFTNQANNLLDEALLGGKLPADVRGLLNKAASGEMPLTVDVAEQLKTRIGDLQRATIDKSEKLALGMVRKALDDTPLLPGQDIGRESINAFNKARGLNRAWMKIVEKTPALEAVRDGIEPDKFVQQFITGAGGKANVADLAALRQSIKGSPEAMAAVKDQIASHLKNKALSGAADEVGNVSQAGYNKALEAIGDRKLRMFFDPKEVAELKAIGRVASYEQVAPAGAFPNRSNTAGALAGFVERVANSPILAKIPFGRVIAEPAGNIALGMRAKGALDAPAALAGQPALPPPRGRAPLLLSPAVLAGGGEE